MAQVVNLAERRSERDKQRVSQAVIRRSALIMYRLAIGEAVKAMNEAADYTFDRCPSDAAQWETVHAHALATDWLIGGFPDDLDNFAG